MGLLEDAIRQYATFADRTTDPAAPSAGERLVYVKDGSLWHRGPTGSPVEVGGGGGGGGGGGDYGAPVIDDALDSLSTLTAVSGTWTIVGGVLQHTGTGNFFSLRHNTVVPGSRWYLKADIRVPASSGVIDAGVSFRCKSTDTTGTTSHVLTAFLYRVSGSGGLTDVRLFRSNAAVVQFTLPSALALGTWHTVEVFGELAGMAMFVNGAPAAAAGFVVGEGKRVDRVGFTAQGTVEYRNFIVRSAPIGL
jgi:hypothetical protein